VPQSCRAIAIVNEMAEIRFNEFVFPGRKQGRALTEMSILRDLRPGITAHGFRSTFKDWSAECTNSPNLCRRQRLRMRLLTRLRAPTAAATYSRKGAS
jgi:integrase